ncbi:unnamed protein product [Pieris brassicae]|uniref:Uncharacterized protein n=1 Tax=Pieris brassicae TaxID=7116 RepID=A0A9P0TH50_PIEBR|nr:unnamed protein product [Pieris brassicae]
MLSISRRINTRCEVKLSSARICAKRSHPCVLSTASYSTVLAPTVLTKSLCTLPVDTTVCPMCMCVYKPAGAPAVRYECPADTIQRKMPATNLTDTKINSYRIVYDEFRFSGTFTKIVWQFVIAMGYCGYGCVKDKGRNVQ